MLQKVAVNWQMQQVQPPIHGIDFGDDVKGEWLAPLELVIYDWLACPNNK
jgi:hypothetical protein